ncbi:hypothetical protein Q3G72_000164 [Acer saccharum]|nr:hypothetical protein Q3G72_000164 [Acer saccharum]
MAHIPDDFEAQQYDNGWSTFDQMEEMGMGLGSNPPSFPDEQNINGKITTKAVCKFCKATLLNDSSCGVSHIKRHGEKCAKDHAPKDPRQTTLMQNEDGQISTFRYNQKAMRTGLAQYIASAELPFTVAESFDPRINLSGVEMLIDDIKGFLKTSLDVSMDQVRECFNQMFLWYNLKYGPNTTSTSVSTPNANSSGDGQHRHRNVWERLGSKGKRKVGESSTMVGFELTKYNDTDWQSLLSEEESLNFDIMSWWKSHESSLPVLSIMARDILTLPVSTVALEYAFSAGGTVLDERRSRLGPDILEAVVCLKDWEDAEQRAQKWQDQTAVEFFDLTLSDGSSSTQ